MHDRAYPPQCAAAERRHRDTAETRRVGLTLVALALGTFAMPAGRTA